MSQTLAGARLKGKGGVKCKKCETCTYPYNEMQCQSLISPIVNVISAVYDHLPTTSVNV